MNILSKKVRNYNYKLWNPDQIISHGSQSELYSEIGLDKKSLEYRINEIYNHISSNKKIVE